MTTVALRSKTEEQRSLNTGTYYPCSRAVFTSRVP